MSEDRRLSPVYQRFNGVMFGLFAQMGAFRASREHWPDLRDQMSRLAAEIDLDLEVPERVEDFAEQRGSAFSAVLGLGEQWSAFKLAFGLGYGFAGLATGVEVMERSHLEGGISALGLDPGALDGWLEGVSRDERGRPGFDDLMTAGLKLTAELVRTCDPEPETCFVAMPFRDPYPDYYQEVYRPLLEAHGFRCLRGWGGMRFESHHEILLTLIERSGWLFAELTDANPNVAYELGFATGRGKPTLAIMDTNPDRWVSWRIPGQPKKLSNLRGIAVLPYDSADPGWREDLIEGAGARYVEITKMEARAQGSAATGPRSILARALLAVRALFFLVLCPGTVAVFLPYLILESAGRVDPAAPGPQAIAAAFLIAAGAAVLLSCVWHFAVAGRGTLAPVDPPRHLVVSGLYRFTRNPMYNGVLAVLLGEAWLFSSPRLLSYAAAVFVAFHAFIVLHEERALAAEFGRSYAEYREAVPRWGFTVHPFPRRPGGT